MLFWKLLFFLVFLIRVGYWVILSENFKTKPAGCLTRLWHGKWGLLIGLSQLYGCGLLLPNPPSPSAVEASQKPEFHGSLRRQWNSSSSVADPRLDTQDRVDMPSSSLLLLLISYPLISSLPHWCRNRLAHSSHTPRPAHHPNSCQFGSGPGPCGGEVCLKGPGEVCGGARDRYGKCAEGLLCSDCNR